MNFDPKSLYLGEQIGDDSKVILGTTLPARVVIAADEYARHSMHGGNSFCRRQGEQRQITKWPDNRCAQYGHAGHSGFHYGSYRPWIAHREEADKHPRIGDDAKDYPLDRIDIKSSTWHSEIKNLLHHHLWIKCTEAEKSPRDTVYVKAFTFHDPLFVSPAGWHVILVGWITNEEFLKEARITWNDEGGVLVYELDTWQLHRLKPVHWNRPGISNWDFCVPGSPCWKAIAGHLQRLGAKNRI